MGERIHDTVIVGSGPAGYTAALYAARANLDVLLLGGFERGGQIMLSSEVENYPGFEEGIPGPRMMDKFEAQAVRFGARMRPENVERVDFSEYPFRLWVEGEEDPTLARSVIIAMGAKPKSLGVEGEARLMGRGVSGCATCDAFFFREKKFAVVAGEDTAMAEALHLSGYARRVLIIHRHDRFRASKIMLERARRNPRITILTYMVIEEILGEHSVEGILVKNLKTNEDDILEVDGLFMAIGSEPASGMFEGQIEMDEDGYILRYENTMTSVPGVFSAGEVSDGSYRQVTTAVGDGCRAAIDAERWLEARNQGSGSDSPKKPGYPIPSVL